MPHVLPFSDHFLLFIDAVLWVSLQNMPSELLDNRRLNSKAILCYALIYCIILASRHNMLMYLS